MLTDEKRREIEQALAWRLHARRRIERALAATNEAIDGMPISVERVEARKAAAELAGTLGRINGSIGLARVQLGQVPQSVEDREADLQAARDGYNPVR